jgi:gliding motility-associated-like protein
MNPKLSYFLFILIFLSNTTIFSQDISLFKQYNGRYDFVFFGNTLNKTENGTGAPCEINTSSSALLSLNPDDEIENAYLYWAGSGNGDFNIKLNNQDVVAQRTFSVVQETSGLPFFSAFADITNQVKNTGNGNYTVTDLDLTNVINFYCFNGTNFGGWAIIVVYKNSKIPLNQLTIYDGLQYVPNEINITLNSLNVIDNEDARIGFVAWEGDQFISVNETLRVNGNPLSNPPLNPVNNAFNGTNSFTGSNTLYNMDLDVYNIQNNIKIGDTSAKIQLTSGQDFVMINSIVTKLNSQLPDATIRINSLDRTCDSRKIDINYTVFNRNSTNSIALGMPIAVYANGSLLSTSKTTTSLPIDGSENGSITIQIPENIVSPFEVKLIVDDDGTGTGIITELNEINNSDTISNVVLKSSPKINQVQNIESCNEGFGRAIFDFSNYQESVKVTPTDTVSFYDSLQQATLGVDNGGTAITSTSSYQTTNPSTTIYIRIQNEFCFTITSFQLITKNCLPTVYNFISANNDGRNDIFTISGLKNIFINHKISIYNRWGVLIWEGNNTTEDWDGYASKGLRWNNQRCPSGTYFYTIELNDVEYPKPIAGFLYLTN